MEVISVRTDKPITTLKTTVTRDDGTVVLDGTAVCYTMDTSGGPIGDRLAHAVRT